MSIQDKNYLLFVPSRLVSNPQSIAYQVKGQETAYTGMQTNEAVTKYLVDYLDGKDMKLDKVIMLCTDEVQNERMLAIGKQTTLEYYQSVICEFLAQNERYNNIDLEELFEVIPYSVVDYEVNETRKTLNEIMRITEDGEAAFQKHLYVDFTGGPRSSALTLVFTCRILQLSGVAVEKILYSNIIVSSGKRIGEIEDCTNVYNVFAKLEAVEAAAHGDISKLIEAANKEGNKAITDSLKKFGQAMEKTEEANQMNQLDAIIDAFKEFLDSANAIADQKDSLEGALISEGIKSRIQTSKKLVENPEYMELLIWLLDTKQYDKALNNFREKAIRMLIDFRIIEDRPEKFYYERDLANEFMAAYCYYETPTEDKISRNKGSVKRTFMDDVRDYVKMLSESQESDPVDILNERNRSLCDELKERVSKIPDDKLPRGFVHNNYSQRCCHKKIIPCLEPDVSGSVDVRRLVEQYQKMERVYMGYGFPFACTYSNYFFEEYEGIYRENMECGAISLHNFFNGIIDGKMRKALTCFPEESFTYKTLIQKLQEERYEKILHIIFPFKLSTKNICLGEIQGEKWEEFSYDFVRSFYSVKQVRNKITHKGSMKDGDFERAIQTVRRVLEQLKEIEDERTVKCNK